MHISHTSHMKQLITFILVIPLTSALAQISPPAYFDEYDMPIAKDHAFYYRTVIPITESGKFQVKESYINDTLRETGFYLDKEIYIKDGVFSTYFESGKKSSEGSYKNNRKIGKWKKWYPNGQLQEEGSYNLDNDINRRFTIENFWDSLGNQLTSNGGGEYISDELDPFKYSRGQIREGYKHGLWIGYSHDGTIAFEEKYDKNKLKDGYSFDSAGKKIKYNEVTESGNQSFYEHVAQTIRYPPAARRSGIEGQVVILVVIDPQGKIINSRLIKRIGGGCDEEAVRVVMQYDGKWGTEKHRGQFVKNSKPKKMYLPIVFKLG